MLILQVASPSNLIWNTIYQCSPSISYMTTPAKGIKSQKKRRWLHSEKRTIATLFRSLMKINFSVENQWPLVSKAATLLELRSVTSVQALYNEKRRSTTMYEIQSTDTGSILGSSQRNVHCREWYLGKTTSPHFFGASAVSKINTSMQARTGKIDQTVGELTKCGWMTVSSEQEYHSNVYLT